MTNSKQTTVVVIGAGPVGLAAASHLSERGITPIVLESGPTAGAAIANWRHVRVFSPWKFNIDSAARRLLLDSGWTEPHPDHLPTGAELIKQYLTPLAETPQLASHIRFNTTVMAVSRQGVDKTRTVGRENRPYVVRTRTTDGTTADIIADSVIDASGTWGHSNPLGSHGLAAPGETEIASYQAGPLPDVAGADRDRFAGKHTMVAGMGHSAANALLALSDLAEEVEGTQITWVIRDRSAARLYGGGEADALPARGKLGSRVKELVAAGKLQLIAGFTIDEFIPAMDGPVTVIGHAGEDIHKFTVDTIVAATGFRPDLDMLREVRLDLDPGTEAPTALAPLIDPNFHSCGTVPPHGERQLAHPDEGFYIVGMKSYGRAPTFLMATGYEQVRSIAAALAGDRAAADDVQLELPETGVCNSNPTTEDENGVVTAASGCCGDSASGSSSSDDSCGSSAQEAGRGLSTGVLHGYSGQTVTLPVAQSSCCGSAPAVVDA